MTVSNSLDCDSGCTIKRASGKGIESLVVSIVCEGFESCGKKIVVPRTNGEDVICELSKAVCQARTEENILENAPKHSSANVGAAERASRLFNGRVARHASWLLNW